MGVVASLDALCCFHGLVWVAMVYGLVGDRGGSVLMVVSIYGPSSGLMVSKSLPCGLLTTCRCVFSFHM